MSAMPGTTTTTMSGARQVVSAQESVGNNQLHRIVAESDLEALRKVWQPNTNDDDASSSEKNVLTAAVDAAVWELLLEMVHPVTDRTYADYTLKEIVTNERKNDEINRFSATGSGNNDTTWEALVDTSALERVRQLRSQVRQKAAAVQQKRQQVLSQVEVLTKQQQPSSSTTLQQQQPTLLAPSVQQAYLQKAQETQSAVDSLIQDMDDLHVKIPNVVQRFQDTLTTVQEEGRPGETEQAILTTTIISPDDHTMADEEENKAPAEDRLLRFLAMQ